MNPSDKQIRRIKDAFKTGFIRFLESEDDRDWEETTRRIICLLFEQHDAKVEPKDPWIGANSFGEVIDNIMKPSPSNKEIPCNGEWHTLSYDEYAKKYGGRYPRSCPECHSFFNPKPKEQKQELTCEQWDNLMNKCRSCGQPYKSPKPVLPSVEDISKIISDGNYCLASTNSIAQAIHQHISKLNGVK